MIREETATARKVSPFLTVTAALRARFGEAILPIPQFGPTVSKHRGERVSDTTGLAEPAQRVYQWATREIAFRGRDRVGSEKGAASAPKF